jgi:hypothetical protein
MEVLQRCPCDSSPLGIIRPGTFPCPELYLPSTPLWQYLPRPASTFWIAVSVELAYATASNDCGKVSHEHCHLEIALSAMSIPPSLGQRKPISRFVSSSQADASTTIRQHQVVHRVSALLDYTILQQSECLKSDSFRATPYPQVAECDNTDRVSKHPTRDPFRHTSCNVRRRRGEA